MNNGTLLSGTIARILPDNFERLNTLPPVAILRQLAYELGRKTKNIIEGDVRTSLAGTAGYRRLVIHTFEIIAPALDGIRYELFRVEQEMVELYPLTLSPTDGILDIPINNPIQTEADFITALEQVFASEKTKRTIASLITQSTAVVPSGLGDENPE